MSISDKIVGLRIATRRATMCENTDSLKNTLSLKTKILFLLREKGLPPSDLMNTLVIAKTNLAFITGGMAREGLLVKQKQQGDRREIVYVITPQGKEYLQKRLDIIEQSAKKSLVDQEEYQIAEAKLEDTLAIFDFLC